MGDFIRVFAAIETNVDGYIVPGLITRVYDEQPEDSDEAVDAHFFVPSNLNKPGNVVFKRGIRHAENKANPKADKFIFLGEDRELLKQAENEPAAVEEVAPTAPPGTNPAGQNLDRQDFRKERRQAAMVEQLPPSLRETATGQAPAVEEVAEEREAVTVTAEDVGKLEDVFDPRDTNQDGEVSKKERKEAAKAEEEGEATE